EQAFLEAPAFALLVLLQELLALEGVVPQRPPDLVQVALELTATLLGRIDVPAGRRLGPDRGQQYLGDLLFLGRQFGPQHQRINRLAGLVDGLGLRLHQLFLESEINLLQARLHLLERVNGLIDDEHAQCRRGGLAGTVRDLEMDAAVVAGFVDVLVRLDLDLQVRRRLDVNNATVANDFAGSEHLIGMDLQGAKRLRRQVDLLERLAVLDVEPLGQQRLAILDQVEVDGGQASRRADVDGHAVAALVDGLVEAEQDIFAERVAA